MNGASTVEKIDNLADIGSGLLSRKNNDVTDEADKQQDMLK